MTDEFKIKRIIAQLDNLKEEVRSMLPEPKPEPKAMPVPKPEPKVEPKPEPKVEAAPARKVAVAPAPEPQSAANAPRAYEPTAMDRFWEKIEDWFAVRGEFAPKGMTREFAV
ncbi:MAG: hypothetical protein K6F50_09470, partial [Kiritimatiellae bacterium]|nr:hypothetical protein [Kiritimatiellia bacterium]